LFALGQQAGGKVAHITRRPAAEAATSSCREATACFAQHTPLVGGLLLRAGGGKEFKKRRSWACPPTRQTISTTCRHPLHGTYDCACLRVCSYVPSTDLVCNSVCHTASPALSFSTGGGKELKKETQLGLSTKKADDFSKWYSELVVASELISYYDVSGCYILRPWAFSMWEVVQRWFDDNIKKLGVQVRWQAD
jgi:hypothetical protein